MTERAPATSGRLMLAACLLIVLTAIISTVLLANDNRNLNLVLTHFGFDPFIVTRAPITLKPYQMKKKRLPRPPIMLEERLLANNIPADIRFVRAIETDPKVLCAALAKAGFMASEWTESGFDKSSWECASYREFPTDRNELRPPSSAFILIKGNQAARVSSFRIKMNIENQNTARFVTGAAETAVRVFLNEVRWEDAPEILENIRSLQQFDIIRFGNKIQLKKEFARTPRYNLLIMPDHQGNRRPFLPDFFDRTRWLPFPDDHQSRPPAVAPAQN